MKKYFLIFLLTFAVACGGGDGDNDNSNSDPNGDLTLLTDGSTINSENNFQFLTSVDFDTQASNCDQQENTLLDDTLVIYADETGEIFKITLVDEQVVYVGDFTGFGFETFQNDEGQECVLSITPYPYNFDTNPDITLTLRCEDGCTRIWEEDVNSANVNTSATQ